mmetsp:Transcript_43557/g.70713  ORF Transcript_43557/g.70713 Transcript_43557/m.70713 type:complete len:439 (+) Transcript_43557:146-1462(+)
MLSWLRIGKSPRENGTRSKKAVVQVGVSWRTFLKKGRSNGNGTPDGAGGASSTSPMTAMHRSNSVQAIGKHSDLGRMSEQQDEYLSLENVCSDPNQSLIGVMDGHGVNGGSVSRWVKEQLPYHIMMEPIFHPDTPRIVDEAEERQAIFDALRRAFLRTDDALSETCIDTELSGCTATIALVRGVDLYVAHVGDSRLVLGRENNVTKTIEAVPMTQDHAAEVPEEKLRIEQRGGRVIQRKNRNGEDVGPPRVYHMEIRFPGLAVTRAMGDKFAKTLGVIADPDVIHRRLDPNDKFLILSSDGVWSSMENQHAVDLVAKYSDAQAASESLTQKALDQQDENYKRDNITVVCVFFSPPPAESGDSPHASPHLGSHHTHRIDSPRLPAAALPNLDPLTLDAPSQPLTDSPMQTPPSQVDRVARSPRSTEASPGTSSLRRSLF